VSGSDGTISSGKAVALLGVVLEHVTAAQMRAIAESLRTMADRGDPDTRTLYIDIAASYEARADERDKTETGEHPVA
jgi:type VI protein secretion system component VasK